MASTTSAQHLRQSECREIVGGPPGAGAWITTVAGDGVGIAHRLQGWRGSGSGMGVSFDQGRSVTPSSDRVAFEGIR
jgi:hypothetical protein